MPIAPEWLHPDTVTAFLAALEAHGAGELGVATVLLCGDAGFEVRAQDRFLTAHSSTRERMWVDLLESVGEMLTEIDLPADLADQARAASWETINAWHFSKAIGTGAEEAKQLRARASLLTGRYTALLAALAGSREG